MKYGKSNFQINYFATKYYKISVDIIINMFKAIALTVDIY